VNKIIAICIYIVAFGVYIVLSISDPWVLGDKNEFLKNFVNHELLNVLGVIMAITLASAANLHLEFNKIEDVAQKTILTRARAAVRKSAFSMIVLFTFAVVIVTVKPLLPPSDVMMSFANGATLLIVLFNILVLTDLTKLVFTIEPLFKMMPKDEETT
jgi:hypothetical protein